MILVTGASGLIGRHLTDHLKRSGLEVRTFDIAASPHQDVCDREALSAALRGVEGVVHLAAVSRVIFAERQPLRCQAVNVDALGSLLRLCLDQPSPPWFVFVSSREVYGQSERFPVNEDFDLNPMNSYARSKVAGEELVKLAIEAGLGGAVCRLSSVYGCALDYPDRVVMAFAGVAARGGVIRIEGAENAFDFTAIEDVVQGLWLLIQATRSGEALPPIHFVTGKATSLLELAALARRHALVSNTAIEYASARTFDVARFVGDPGRAAELLGWRAQIPVSTGVPRLIAALQRRDATL